MITTTDFVYPFFIDTSNAGVRNYLTSIIDFVEGKYLHLVECEDEMLLKDMLKGFVYALYASEQLRINTPIGGINFDSDNGSKDLEISKAFNLYNNSVEIFNTYVIDTENEISYINQLGI